MLRRVATASSNAVAGCGGQGPEQGQNPARCAWSTSIRRISMSNSWSLTGTGIRDAVERRRIRRLPEPEQDSGLPRKAAAGARQRQAGDPRGLGHAHMPPAPAAQQYRRQRRSGSHRTAYLAWATDGQRPAACQSPRRTLAREFARPNGRGRDRLIDEGGPGRSAISTAKARSVVPPGLVTPRRSSAAVSGLAARSAPEPITVSRASICANAAGMPCAMAARSSNSTSRKTYAGPLPDTAVTGSSKPSSSTHATRPTDASSVSHKACCGRGHALPRAGDRDAPPHGGGRIRHGPHDRAGLRPSSSASPASVCPAMIERNTAGPAKRR